MGTKKTLQINESQKNDEPKKKIRKVTQAMKENPGGRPSSFEESSKSIVKYLRRGNTYATASICSGVTYETFANWMRQGEKDGENGDVESRFFRFFMEVKKAEKDCEDEIVGHWLREIPKNWKAGQEFLARRHSSDWSSKDRVDVTSNGQNVGAPVFLPMKKNDD